FRPGTWNLGPGTYAGTDPSVCAERAHLLRGERGAVGAPARRHEDVAEGFAPALRAADVAGDRFELVKGDLQRVESMDVLGQAVAHRRALGLEGAEEAIPDDEDASVVAIEVLDVRTVMNAMMRRRVEELLEPTHAIDELGVEPEL